MTSLADQDLDQLGGPLSILTRQKRDHERLDRLLKRLAHSSPGAEQQATFTRSPAHSLRLFSWTGR